MKKRIIVFLSIILVLMICCSEKNIENSTFTNSSINGKIEIVGNEPFTKLALQINDSTIYLLECTNEINNSLLKNQGELYKIYFNKKLETELGTKIIVTKAEQILK